MYVYQRSEQQLWTVGFYTPDGKWISENDYECKDDAAERVHWLNGGGKPSDIIKDFFDEKELQEVNDKIYDLVRRCGRCGGAVRREKKLDYPYYCPRCEENLFEFETCFRKR